MARVPPRNRRLTRFEAKYSLLPLFLCAIPFGIGLAFAARVATHLGVGLPSLVLLAPCLVVFGFYVLQQRNLANEKMWRKTRLPLWTRLRFGAERGPLTCGYCRADLDEEAESACDDCGAVYHESCRAELGGGCGTVGCGEAPRRRAPGEGSKRAA